MLLEGSLNEQVQSSDRALLTAMVLGAVRRWHYWCLMTEQLVHKPFRQRDFDVHCLLVVGLVQIHEMGVAAHAAVSETVAATKVLNKPWAAGVINAALRRFLRERDEIVAQAEAGDAELKSHPQWLVDQLALAWPAHWRQILLANNDLPPIWLRANPARTTLNALQDGLRNAGVETAREDGLPDALRCLRSVEVRTLPGYREGAFAVQDGAAQWPAQLLRVASARRILDACAAPGGKSAHLRALAAVDAEVVALDIDPTRVARMAENFARLQIECRTVVADAGNPDQWWDGVPFDRILLDAPCSGTGVIRRHPDIKLLRRAGDVDELVRQQARLLRQLWPLLQPGGLLLYATCSILPKENALQIDDFLSTNPDAKFCPLPEACGTVSGVGRQRFPGDGQMDGFFYALLQKKQ